MKKLSFFKKGFSKLFQNTHFFIQLNQRDKKLKRIESGRSMVEMLGVLAVVGALSVGGILGYKYGMTKWKANETVNELNLRANDIAFRMEKLIELDHEGEIEMEMGNVTRLGYPIMARLSPQYLDYFEIFLSDVPSDVCKELLKSQWQAPYSIFVGVTEYEATADICDQAEEVELAYEFYKDLTRKEDLPEELQHKTQRCTHDNHCQCGICNEEYGLCESTCPRKAQCAKDYDDPRWRVCCDKEFIVDGYCCASVTEDGKCCDREGNCCPPDKPLKDENGVCHSCEEPSGFRLLNSEKCSIRCPKRYINNSQYKMCVLCGAKGTSVEDKPLGDWQGKCHSCDERNGINGGNSPAAVAETTARCSMCPNRVMNGVECSLVRCSGDTPLFASDGKCYPCDDTTHIIRNSALTDACTTLCPNRKSEGNYCVAATCPADKPLQDKYGKCHSCDEESSVTMADMESCSTVCPKRYSSFVNVAQCALCGVKGTPFENKPILDYLGKCYSCDYPERLDMGGATPKETLQALCSGKCPNRQISNGWLCYLKCSGDTPLFAKDGKCYSCEDTEHVIRISDLTDTCENLCPNRKTDGGYCVITSTCPADKPLKDKHGICYSCDEADGVDVGTHGEYCSVCPKRRLMGGWDNKNWCSLCGVEGTTVENKPLFNDVDGKCYNCYSPEAPYQITLKETRDLCENVCPNREMVKERGTSGHPHCVLPCPEDKPLRIGVNSCATCDDTVDPSSAWQQPSCEEVCPNRKNIDNTCAWQKSFTCSNGYFIGKDGGCYSCRITTAIAVTDEESCTVCLNRVYQDGLCIDTKTK